MRIRGSVKSSVLCLLVSWSVMAGADEVYRWLDEEGVVHFSQWPPTGGHVDVTVTVVPSSNSEDYDPLDDPYSVLNQAERIHEFWSELRAERAEEGRERAEAKAAEVAHYRERLPYDYYRRAAYYPVHRPRIPRHPPGRSERKEQLQVLSELGHIDRPQPYSINSSAHRARVEASREVPFRKAWPSERR